MDGCDYVIVGSGAGGGTLAARLAEWLERLPEVRVESPILAAHLVLHTLLDAIHRFVIAPPRGFDIDACEEELMLLLLRYLRAEPRVAQP